MMPNVRSKNGMRSSGNGELSCPVNKEKKLIENNANTGHGHHSAISPTHRPQVI